MRLFGPRPHAVLAIAFLCGLAGGACKKPSDVPSESPRLGMPESAPVDSTRVGVPDGQPADTLKTENDLDAQLAAEDQLQIEHHRTMVAPSPAGFRPAVKGRKIALSLALEKTKIKAGDFPRIRLTLTNIGSEPIEYEEPTSSFFVAGATILDSRALAFFVTDSRGRRERVLPYSASRKKIYPSRKRELPAPLAGLSSAEKDKWMAQANAKGRANSSFSVKLLPGEALQSMGDDAGSADSYRTLYSDTPIDTPGKYRLKAVYDDRPPPLTPVYVEAMNSAGTSADQSRRTHESRLKLALGPVTTSEVLFEVSP